MASDIICETAAPIVVAERGQRKREFSRDGSHSVSNGDGISGSSHSSNDECSNGNGDGC